VQLHGRLHLLHVDQNGEALAHLGGVLPPERQEVVCEVLLLRVDCVEGSRWCCLEVRGKGGEEKSKAMTALSAPNWPSPRPCAPRPSHPLCFLSRPFSFAGKPGNPSISTNCPRVMRTVTSRAPSPVVGSDACWLWHGLLDAATYHTFRLCSIGLPCSVWSSLRFFLFLFLLFFASYWNSASGHWPMGENSVVFILLCIERRAKGHKKERKKLRGA
jgi:hypothetical protein